VPFRRRFEFPPYVSTAERHLLRQRVAARFAARAGELSPVVIDGHKIAHTFWGNAWCDNLERYSDFANRLPRGRSYVRSGAVIDLRVEPGHVVARVAGSDVYKVEVSVAAMPAAQWKALCRDCAGAIDSVVALLQGALPAAVIARLYERERGLFPSPRQIAFRCSCPDRATMCKHVAAVLYGIGSRLDQRPELLFVLRRVDQEELVARAGVHLERGARPPASNRLLEAADLSELFGIEISSAAPTRRRASAAPRRRRVRAPR